MTDAKPAVLFIGLLIASSATCAAAPSVREGLWEVSAAVEGRKTPPTTVQHCMTQKDMQDPQKFVSGGEGTGCEIKDHKTQDNVVTWSMVCTGKTPMTGTGSITFAETSYTGRSTLSVSRGDKPVQLTIRYNGRYLGPCKK
ncbi:MAG: DUF3617 domain-containing protein [Betaproteobacteria bacterium]